MFDQRLWNTHIHLREQQFMREAEHDRLANEHWKKYGSRSPLLVALREALAIFRKRIGAAAHAEMQPVEAQPPTADEKVAALLAEVEEIIRECCADPSVK